MTDCMSIQEQVEQLKKWPSVKKVEVDGDLVTIWTHKLQISLGLKSRLRIKINLSEPYEQTHFVMQSSVAIASTRVAVGSRVLERPGAQETQGFVFVQGLEDASAFDAIEGASISFCAGSHPSWKVDFATAFQQKNIIAIYNAIKQIATQNCDAEPFYYHNIVKRKI